MKLAVEFPSVAYREGGDSVVRLAQGIEEIGYDQLDMFDHVIMGFPTETSSRASIPGPPVCRTSRSVLPPSPGSAPSTTR